MLSSRDFKNMFVLNSMIQDRIRDIALKVHPDYFLEVDSKTENMVYFECVLHETYISNRVAKMKNY